MTSMNSKRNLDRRGLTLTELMITLSIFGIIMAVVMGFVTGARNSYSDTRERAQYQQSMRAVLSMMTRELRSAGCDPSGAAFDALRIADVDLMQCQMDFNGDSDTVDMAPDEMVAYLTMDGSDSLWRVAPSGVQAIMQGITRLEYTYFDETGAQLATVPLNATDRAAVRHVNITIEGETDRGEPVSYTTRVTLRNG
jgi:prepilin-type N-terminal cleavage/methylation domain-containing protein